MYTMHINSCRHRHVVIIHKINLKKVFVFQMRVKNTGQALKSLRGENAQPGPK